MRNIVKYFRKYALKISFASRFNYGTVFTPKNLIKERVTNAVLVFLKQILYQIRSAIHVQKIQSNLCFISSDPFRNDIGNE